MAMTIPTRALPAARVALAALSSTFAPVVVVVGAGDEVAVEPGPQAGAIASVSALSATASERPIFSPYAGLEVPSSAREPRRWAA